MKKLFTLFLCLVMLCTLTMPAFAAAADPVQQPVLISAGPDGTQDPGLTPEAEWEAITAHGGVPGQINVMVNGKCVKFPDAVPEITNDRTMVPFRAVMDALGGESDYDGATRTVTCVMGETTLTLIIGAEDMTVTRGGETTAVKMDCAPYIKNDRTYVPVRFISEALGYNVGWDGDYRTAIITDMDALAEQIDKDFTILNKYIASQPPIESAQKAAGSTTATITLLDSMNGNQSKTLTASYDGIISPKGYSLKMDYDFAELWDLMEGYMAVPPVEGEAYDNYIQQLEQIKAMLSGSAQLRMDAENLVIYYGVPALNALLRDAGADVADDAWLSLDLGALLEELEEAGAILAEAETGAAAPTVGQQLCSAIYSLGSGANDIDAYDAALEIAGVLAGVAGDKKFTTSGSTHTLTLAKADLIALTEDLDLDGLTWDALSKFSFTLKLEDSGDADVALDCTLAMNDGTTNLGDMVQLSLNATRKGGKADATMECHVKNVVKVTVESTQTTTATDKAPEIAPPEGVPVVDLSELNSGAITSPDGP